MEIIEIFGATANKTVYMVKMRDWDDHGAVLNRFFVVGSEKIVRTEHGLDFVGYEVESANIKTYKEALETINSEQSNLSSWFFPWHNVMSIQNVSYYQKISKALVANNGENK